MKTLLPLCFLLLCAKLLSQSSQSSGEPLSVEWKWEDVNLKGVRGLLFNADQIIIGSTPGLFLLDQSSQKLKFTTLPSGVFNLQWYQNGKMYVMGAGHLNFFDVNLNQTGQIALMRFDQTNLTAENGCVGNGKLYTSHHFNDFIKYDLNGNQVFRKPIATASDNKFLQIGKDKIYLYSIIGDPALGGRLMQYDTLGNQKWSISVGSVDAMATDESGFCYISTSTGESVISKIDSDGNTIWSKPVSGQNVRSMSLRGDSILVCGNISLSAIGSDNRQWCAFSILSAKTGEILLQQVMKMTEGTDDYESFHQIASDGRNIYIGGARSQQLEGSSFLLKLSKTGATGLNEQKTPSKTSFSIFPNPGSNRFTLSTGNNDVSSLHVTVRNINGQVIYSKQLSHPENNSFTLDLGKQPAGTYFIEIESGGEKSVKKIVVE